MNNDRNITHTHWSHPWLAAAATTLLLVNVASSYASEPVTTQVSDDFTDAATAQLSDEVADQGATQATAQISDEVRPDSADFTAEAATEPPPESVPKRSAGTAASKAVSQSKTSKKKLNVRTPVRGEERRFQKRVRNWTELKTKNIVMQERDFSCGAAALATVMKYHWGRGVSETQLLVSVFRSLTIEQLKDRIENGLSLTDLKNGATKHNYLASIGKLKFDKLQESKVPLIVGITFKKFDHFVVVRGTDDQYVYLADPARGNLRLPIDEFKEQWQENAVLVIVDKARIKNPAIDSPLLVRPEEKSFGELNRWYLRDRTILPTLN